MGYAADSAEVALTLNSSDKTKVKFWCHIYYVSWIIFDQKHIYMQEHISKQVWSLLLRCSVLLLQAIEFLELEKSFKEWGFNEDNIQEALRAANNDRDKALDYLMTLSTA